MTLADVRWLSVLVAALSTFVLGGLWYSPFLFGKVWQSLVGLSDEELQHKQARVFTTAFVLAFVAALNLAFFIGPARTTSFGLFAGAAAGAGWVATALATTFTFERRSPKLVAIDAGYHVVAYASMGAILGAWPA